MKPHRGINSTSVAGEGLEGLPGLLMAIAFVFFPLAIILPRYIQRDYKGWILGLFLTAEIVSAALYIRGARRDRKASEELKRVLHQINEQED